MTTALSRPRPRVVDQWSYVPVPLDADCPQLVCLPHAGGDVTAFTALAEALAPRIEVWAVRLPARGGRYADPMPATFDQLVTDVAAALRPVLRPTFALYGQSFGALLGYEVARALAPQHSPAAVLVASASAPAGWRDRVPDDAAAGDLLTCSGAGALIGDDETLLELALGTTRADLAVCRTYRGPDGPLDGVALHVLAGRADPMLDPAGLAAWADCTTGPTAVSAVDGGHLLAATAAAATADVVVAALASASSNRTLRNRPALATPRSDRVNHNA